jgi:hypothetical protein
MRENQSQEVSEKERSKDIWEFQDLTTLLKNGEQEEGKGEGRD